MTFRVNVQRAGCQSLAPFTNRVVIVNHFLVQTVPFFLDTVAHFFHAHDPVVVVHTLLQNPPTPRSRWGSDPTVRRPCRLSYQDCEPCASDRYPNNVRHCPAVTSITSTVLTPLNVQFLFRNILSILLLSIASVLLTLTLLANVRYMLSPVRLSSVCRL